MMSLDTPRPDRLERLGDALHAATTTNLHRAHAARRTRKRRRALGSLAAAVVVVPGVAVAATSLIGSDEVARSLPNGTVSLLGTDPTCTTIRTGVEYDCVMAVAPTGELGAGRWRGTVEPSVDDSKHVNGGCRSLNAAGTHWRCYVGQEAVRQRIIGPALLGESSAGPSAG
ncbi:MAG: hypothetical protein JWO02_2929 [Solirubrobacterales bacterium]|nr:hypothetical protein [Solirubrobacterales bacterium]